MDSVVVDVVENSLGFVGFVVFVNESGEVMDDLFGVGVLVEVRTNFVGLGVSSTNLDQNRIMDVVHIFQSQKGDSGGDGGQIQRVVEVLNKFT